MTDAQKMARKLRESAGTLARQSTHEIPVMTGFCQRLRAELIEAANMLDGCCGMIIVDGYFSDRIASGDRLDPTSGKIINANKTE